MAFTYTKTFTDEEEKVLKDRIIITPTQWIDNAIAGKLSNSLKNLATRRKQELIDGGATTIPAKDTDLATNAFADTAYKNAVERAAPV